MTFIRSRFAARGAAWIAAACVGLAAVDAASPGSFRPDTRAKGAPRLEGEVWAVDAPAFEARLVLLDDATRREFLARHTASATDPFASAPDKPAGFLTFLLDVENRGSGSLRFHPLGCRLLAASGEVRSPLDMETLQTVHEMLERPMPAAYASLERVLLDEEVVLPPGARRTGLLAYRTADLKTRTLRIEVPITDEQGASVGFQAPYRFVKTDGTKAKP